MISSFGGVYLEQTERQKDRKTERQKDRIEAYYKDMKFVLLPHTAW